MTDHPLEFADRVSSGSSRGFLVGIARLGARAVDLLELYRGALCLTYVGPFSGSFYCTCRTRANMWHDGPEGRNPDW
jgi:hypothetical protein